MTAIHTSGQAFDCEDEHYWSDDGELAARMAPVIAALIRQQGGCLPQDVVAAGFSTGEVSRCWRLARALVVTEPVTGAARRADA